MNKALKYFTIVLFISNYIIAQDTIKNPFKYVFDHTLNKVETNALFNDGQIFIIVSSRTCAACVHYFSKSNIKVQYLFYLNSELLLETKNIIDIYYLNQKKDNVHFDTDDILNRKETFIDPNMKSPAMFIIKKGRFILYSYEILSTITNEFQLPYKKLKIKLKNLN
jgi:hypothetical protein